MLRQHTSTWCCPKNALFFMIMPYWVCHFVARFWAQDELHPTFTASKYTTFAFSLSFRKVTA